MRTLRLSGVVPIAFVLVGMVMHISAPPRAFAQQTAASVPLTESAQLASPIACMKELPDGAHVCIHNKSIVGIMSDSLFVEEPDRSSGIRINTAGLSIPYELSPGGLVSCSGTMATVDEARVVNAQEISFSTLSGARIDSLAMASSALLGWPDNPKVPSGPRTTGLLPTNLLVSIWGRVTAKGLCDGEGSWYIYLDDGWGKKDWSEAGCTGVRVYCDIVPTDSEPFQQVVGVLSQKRIDPTPSGPDGDEVTIPVIRTTYTEDVFVPQGQAVTKQRASISGRVRLVGQSLPGTPVRVYSQRDSVRIENVTSEWQNFTLKEIPVDGGVVAASAAGYLSETVNANGGSADINIELQPSRAYMEASVDKSGIAVCSNESAVVSALYRDCEGKGLSNQQVRLTTTLGVFSESHTKQLVTTTNGSGFVQGHLIPGSDGAGVAFITATEYPEGNATADVSIPFIGPEITLTANQYYFDKPGTAIISATIMSNSTSVPGATLIFKTNAGVFQPANQPAIAAVTDEFGRAQVNLSIKSPSTALVTASYMNHCSQQTLSWLTIAYGAAPWFSQSVSYSNPLVADLDGLPDGKKEIVTITTAGELIVLNASGTALWHESLHPSGSNTPACAVIDGDRSGLPCIFVPAESQQEVYAYSHDGIALAGWPAGTDYVTRKASAAIGDINLDGSAEIVVGDECCFVFSWNPTGDWKKTGNSDSSFLWKNLTGTRNTAIYGSSCALGDLNGDPQGILDVAVGTNHGPETYAFPGDAWGDFVLNPNYLDGWPRTTKGYVESSPALGDIDGDGLNDYAIGSDVNAVFVWLSSDNSWKSYRADGMVRSSPALYDLDDDGKLDIIVGSNSGKVYTFNWRGQSISGWDNGIRLNSAGIYPIESSPVIGDVTGDGQVEIVIGCNDGNVYALYKNGRNHQVDGELTGPIAWAGSCVRPSYPAAQVLTAPVIDDIDNDGKVEILAAGTQGVYIYHLNSPYSQDPALYPWPTFHRDNQRTGCATQPPAPVNASIQGIVTKNGQPVVQARIYIYENDGSPVYQPYTTPPQQRSWICSVGSSDETEAAKGSFCINQLEPNRVYKLKVEATGEPVKWVTGIAVTTGLTRVDIQL